MSRIDTTFSCGDVLASCGVRIQQTPFGVRIVVPPIPSWWLLPKCYFWGTAAMLVAILDLVVCTYSSKASSVASDWLAPFCLLGSFTAVLVGSAIRRLRQLTIIDVTRDELIVTFASASRGWGRLSWPRQQVSEFKLNVDGKILVRSHGRELTDFWIGSNPQVLDALVERVRHAIFESDFAPASPQDAFPPAATFRDSKRLAIPFFFAALATCVVGGVMFFLGIHTGIALLLLGSCAAVPAAGLAYGEQRREYYT